MLTRGPQDDSWAKKLVFALAALAIGVAALVPHRIGRQGAGRACHCGERARGDRVDGCGTSAEILQGSHAYVQGAGWRGLLGLAAEEGDEFQLSPEELRRGGLRVAIATPASTRELVLHGSTVMDAGSLTRVRTPFAGRVESLGEQSGGDKEERRTLRFGDDVNKGQVLATLWSTELAEKKGELYDAVVRLRLDKRAFEQLRELAPREAASERALRDAAQNVEAAEIRQRDPNVHCAHLPSATRRSTASWLPRSTLEVKRRMSPMCKLGAMWRLPRPIAGTIVEKTINVGDVAEAGSELFTMADLTRLSVLAHVHEAEIPLLLRLRRATPLEMRVGGDAVAEPMDGTFGAIRNLVEPNQHTAVLSGHVSMTDGKFNPGQFVTATITIPDETLVEVPSTAVVHDGNAAVAFVGAAGQSTEFQRRKVSIARRFADRVWLRSAPSDSEQAGGVRGINAGDKVLADASFEGKAEQSAAGWGRRRASQGTIWRRAGHDEGSCQAATVNPRTKALAASAKRAINGAFETYVTGAGGDLAGVYDLSASWLAAEERTAADDAGRVAAPRAHLERTQKLHEACKKRVAAHERRKSSSTRRISTSRWPSRYSTPGTATIRRPIPNCRRRMANGRQSPRSASWRQNAVPTWRPGKGPGGDDIREAGLAPTPWRYDGQSFADWVAVLENDLSRERKVEALRALAAFGAHGYAQDAILQILRGVRECEAPRDEAVRALCDLGRRSAALTAELEKAVKQDNPPESKQLLTEALTSIRQPAAAPSITPRMQPIGSVPITTAPAAASAPAATAAPRTSTTAEALARKEQALKQMIDDRTEKLIRAKKDVENLQKNLGILDPSEVFQQMAAIQTQLAALNNTIFSQTSEAANLEVRTDDLKREILLRKIRKRKKPGPNKRSKRTRS